MPTKPPFWPANMHTARWRRCWRLGSATRGDMPKGRTTKVRHFLYLGWVNLRCRTQTSHSKKRPYSHNWVCKSGWCSIGHRHFIFGDCLISPGLKSKPNAPTIAPYCWIFASLSLCGPQRIERQWYTFNALQRSSGHLICSWKKIRISWLETNRTSKEIFKKSKLSYFSTRIQMQLVLKRYIVCPACRQKIRWQRLWCAFKGRFQLYFQPFLRTFATPWKQIWGLNNKTMQRYAKYSKAKAIARQGSQVYAKNANYEEHKRER